MCTQYFHSCCLAGDHCSKNIRLLSIQVDIFCYDILIIPVHQSEHWTLVIVNVTSKEIMYFNSLGHDDDTCLQVVAYVLILDNIYPRNTNSSGSKFTNCDETGFTYNMTVYLGRYRQLTAQHLIATHTSVRIHRENTWPHTVYGQLLFLTGLNHETNLLLWHCPTQQEGNATGLKTPRK